MEIQAGQKGSKIKEQYLVSSQSAPTSAFSFILTSLKEVAPGKPNRESIHIGVQTMVEMMDQQTRQRQRLPIQLQMVVSRTDWYELVTLMERMYDNIEVEEACIYNLKVLKENITGDSRYTSLYSKEGLTEEELWEEFDTVEGEVDLSRSGSAEGMKGNDKVMYIWDRIIIEGPESQEEPPAPPQGNIIIAER